MAETLSSSEIEPIRIGYLLRMYPRLSQTFVVNEIREHERQGADISIASLRLPNEGLFHESLSRVRARAHYASTTRKETRTSRLQMHLRYLRRSPRNYFRALRLVRIDAQAEWSDFANAAFVLKWAREKRRSHVHVHFGTVEATVALTAHVLGGLSYSMTLHAFDIFRDNVDRPLLTEKINASRFTVTVSEFNRRFLIENLPNVEPDKIRVNYNGVDLERFSPGEGQREPFSIFALGRLKEKKGFIHLVSAVRRLRDQGLEVRCRIGGEGPDQKPLKRAIKEWNLRSEVKLLGPLNEEEVIEWMRRSTCFVLPCVQAVDGNVDALPTVLLEAMAAGCPAVSTRLSGVPEIIEDGVSGLLVEPGDDAALADAIRSLLSDAQHSASISEGGRRRAEERFDIRRNVGVMQDWFRSVVDSPFGATASQPGHLRVGPPLSRAPVSAETA